MLVHRLDDRPAGLGRQYRRLAGLSLLILLVDGAFILVYLVCLPVYLVDDLGSREGLAAFTFAAFGAARLLTQTFSGSVSDRLGSGPAAALALVLTSVAVAAMALVRVTWLFPVLALVYGVGGAILWPSIFGAVTRALPVDERGKAAGIMALTTACAGGLAVVGGSFLTQHQDSRAGLVVAFALLCAGAVLAGRVLGGLDHDRSTRLERGGFEWRRLLALLQHRSALVMVFICQAAALGALVPTASRYGVEVLELELHSFAVLLVPAGLVAAVTVNLGGVLADRVGRAPVVVAGFAASAAGFASMRIFAEPEFLPLTAMVAGGGYAMAVPALNAAMMDAAGAGKAGLMLGWFMIAEGAGQALGPAVGGIVLEAGGALAVLDVAVALLAVSAIFGMRMNGSREERRLSVP